jgi:ankyrin repeat protein
MIAALKGHNSIIKKLYAYSPNLDLGNKQGFKTIHMAAISGKIETLEALIEIGADVNIISKSE